MKYYRKYSGLSDASVFSSCIYYLNMLVAHTSAHIFLGKLRLNIILHFNENETLCLLYEHSSIELFFSCMVYAINRTQKKVWSFFFIQFVVWIHIWIITWFTCFRTFKTIKTFHMTFRYIFKSQFEKLSSHHLDKNEKKSEKNTNSDE